MAQTPKPLVVIGILGTTLDVGRQAKRWNHWRPTIGLHLSLGQPIARFEMLRNPLHDALGATITADIATVSPGTVVRRHDLDLADPWDFEEVYGALYEFARRYPFDVDREDYLVHISTGTHVAQICLFLLTESRHLPARLVQTGPGPDTVAGRSVIIDLDTSRYDKIQRRHAEEKVESTSLLKQGIATENTAFNHMIGQIEQVSLRSTAPILLLGPTGAGKSSLARRIHALRRHKRLVGEPFVAVNCATLRGDTAMSTLFGHSRGAFTGAATARAGLLRAADGGMLFLDEIGELGADEQAMLLHAVEEGRFRPVGADSEVSCQFQLVAGTNQPLQERVRDGRFRGDLLARLDTWTFTLPGLAERREDIEPNLDHELDRLGRQLGRRLTLNREARARFLEFAQSTATPWSRNFRDLTAAVLRMATLAEGGRIAVPDVEGEIARLQAAWGPAEPPSAPRPVDLRALLGDAAYAELDRFDAVQLSDVVAVCRQALSLSEAGRVLFAASRQRRASVNDADRLRKYLARFALDWDQVRA
jgi:transcriptional regulatory protein RtcR